MVILTCRTLHFWRVAMCSMLAAEPETISSSHRRPREIAPTRRARRSIHVSHKQLPGEKANQNYLHIEYRILLRAVALALRLIKRIDRHVLGPSAPFVWKEA
jgi:hypothetical protein